MTSPRNRDYHKKKVREVIEKSVHLFFVAIVDKIPNLYYRKFSTKEYMYIFTIS